MYKAIETGNGDSAVMWLSYPEKAWDKASLYQKVNFILETGLTPTQAKALSHSMQIDYDSVTLDELESTDGFTIS